MSFLGSLTFPLLAALIVFAVIYTVTFSLNVPQGVIAASIAGIVVFLIALKRVVLEKE